MLEGRLQKRVRVLNYSDVNEYVEHLFDADHFEAELVHLIDCVTTNKTDFFREPSTLPLCGRCRAGTAAPQRPQPPAAQDLERGLLYRNGSLYRRYRAR